MCSICRIVLQQIYLVVAVMTSISLIAEESLTVVSWGGSYAEACVKGYHERFTDETGIKVDLEDYNGGLAQIRTQVESGSVHWDVVDLNPEDAIVGCDEGILEPINHSLLPHGTDESPATEDFYEGMLSECGVGNVIFSNVIAYNTENIQGEKPSTVQDFFDLKKFPGRRGMRRVPQDNLEWAVMTLGVPVNKVYETLSTKEGLDRAFAKLDTIKDQIVWWEAGAQPPQLLADGEVTMSTAYNGRIFNAQVLEKQSFAIIWHDQILDHSELTIVAGAPNLDNARNFVRFAAEVESMLGVARYIAYSPARKSGQHLNITHAITGDDMESHFPTFSENAKYYLLSNVQWWTDNKEEMNERFNSWLAQ